MGHVVATDHPSTTLSGGLRTACRWTTTEQCKSPGNPRTMVVMTITTPPNAVQVIPGCAFHVPGFLTSQVADSLGAAIVTETSPKWVSQLSYSKGWPARYDRGHTMARFGAPGITYSYKGKPKPMYPFTDSLRQALVRVDLALGTAFNCIVINSYEPGSGL